MNEPDASDVYEIDLRIWGRRIWAARMLAVAVAVAVTVGYWAVWAVWQVKEPPVYGSSHVVEFTFDSAERRLYPNGSPFLLTDVITPDVLSAVYDDSGLDARVIARRDFVAGLRIQPIESSASGMSAARLLFTSDAKHALSAEQIGTFLLDIPRQWSEQAINRGVASESTVSLPTWRIFDETLHETLDYFELVRKLRHDLRMVRRGISGMENLPGGMTARDEGHTGLTTWEIRQAAHHAEEYILNRAFEYISALGLTKNPDTAARIQNLEGRMQRYEVDRLRSQKRAEARHATLRLYSKTVSSSGSVSVIESASGESEADNQRPDRIAVPTLAADDLEWRRAFIHELLRIEHQRTNREGDLLATKNLIDKLQSTTIENKARYIATVEADITEFQRRVRDLLGALHRIHDQYRHHRGPLYRSTGPVEAVPMSGAPPFNQAVLPYFLLLFATMAGTMLLALLIRQPKEGTSPHASSRERNHE